MTDSFGGKIFTVRTVLLWVALSAVAFAAYWQGGYASQQAAMPLVPDVQSRPGSSGQLADTWALEQHRAAWWPSCSSRC
jgi:hypothetical protein